MNTVKSSQQAQRELNSLYHWAAFYFGRKDYRKADEFLDQFFCSSDWQSNVFVCSALFLRGQLAERKGLFPLACEWFELANKHHPGFRVVGCI